MWCILNAQGWKEAAPYSDTDIWPNKLKVKIKATKEKSSTKKSVLFCFIRVFVESFDWNHSFTLLCSRQAHKER
jgi:hypothetical protein